MCGLFGLADAKNVDTQRAQEALNTLTHRGPDQSNFYHEDSVFVGHRRLSILDLSEDGRQPMISEDGNVVMTVNGEIYNYVDLRNELMQDFTFKSKSDSEVLLHGYQKWGFEKMLKRLDGMFAMVIYDKAKKLIYGARDRVGIKPLYYHLSDKFLWSSELKAIESYCDTLSVDKTAIYDYFTYRYIPTPKTLFNDTYKLPPGCFFQYKWDDGSLAINRYWSLKVGGINPQPKEAATTVKKLLNESVRSQLISDVPVGFFLSGGIDSSVVVAEASRIMEKPNTYTIGFNNKSDESGYAKIISDKYNTNHELKYFDSDYKDLFKNLLPWYDEPFADTSAFPSYLVSGMAKKSSTVVLTGDGGDELFGGYDKYFIFQKLMTNKRFNNRLLKSFAAKMNRSKRKVFKAIGARLQTDHLFNEFELLTRLMSGKIKEEKVDLAKQLGIPKDYDDYWYFKKYYDKSLPLLTRLQYLDFNTYLHDDILTKMDRVSMAVSLEVRVPLLSNALVDYLFAIPEEIRYFKSELKGLLKESYHGDLPETILHRGKKGFSVPKELYLTDNSGSNELAQIFDLFKYK